MLMPMLYSLYIGSICDCKSCYSLLILPVNKDLFSHCLKLYAVLYCFLSLLYNKYNATVSSCLQSFVKYIFFHFLLFIIIHSIANLYIKVNGIQYINVQNTIRKYQNCLIIKKLHVSCLPYLLLFLCQDSPHLLYGLNIP